MQDRINTNIVSPILAKGERIALPRQPLREIQPKVGPNLPYRPGSSHKLHKPDKTTITPLVVPKITRRSLALAPVTGRVAALRPITKSELQSTPQSTSDGNHQLRLNFTESVVGRDRSRPERSQHIALENRTNRPLSTVKKHQPQDSSEALHPEAIPKVTRRSSNRRNTWRPKIRDCRAPPATDPLHTAALWTRVKLCNQSSQVKMAPKLAKPTLVPTQTPTDPSASSALDDATSSQAAAKVRDTTFRDTVLLGRGIVFTDAITMETPFAHFKSEIPHDVPSIISWYQDRCGHPECEVWHEKDRDLAVQQATQYRAMVLLQENEAKFSYRGKQYFFKEDDSFPPEEAARGSSTYFKLEWGPQPDGDLLKAPPLQQKKIAAKAFKFYTKPDCTYWLSERRLTAEYREPLKRITYVLIPAGVTAPYFTIEFKKDANSTIQTAENQLAAASALILYNRILLRCKGLVARGKAKETWVSDDFSDIKHYGITFAGNKATFWIVVPTIETSGSEDPWRGCSVGWMFDRNAGDTDKVLEMKEWINEIHHWGLGEYGREFERDVKSVLRRLPGGESRVSLIPDEIAALAVTDV